MNLTSGNELVLKGHTDFLSSLAFSADGTRLASGGKDSTVRIWDTASGVCLHCLTEHRSNVRSVAFSPTAPILASGSHDHFVKLWDVNASRLLATLGPHGGALLGGVGPIAFSPDGRFLASAGGKTFRIWDVNTQNIVHEVKHSAGFAAGCHAVAYSPDGKTLFSISKGQIKAWDTGNWQDQGEIGEYKTMGTAWIRVSPSGRLLVAWQWNPVVIWDIATRKPVASLNACGTVSNDAIFLDDNQLLIAGDAGLALWNTASGHKEIDVPTQELVTALALHRSKQFLALGYYGGNIGLRRCA